jgi:hypothetical protein
MWLATKHGFFSVVCGRVGSGRMDRNKLCIRARQRQHLENLRPIWKGQFGKVQFPKVHEQAGTDYPCRIIVSRSVGLELIEAIAIGVDYDNFKDAAAKEHPDDTRYNHFLHRVWSYGIDIERSPNRGR